MGEKRIGRTAKGNAEISEGRRELKGKLRTVLFLIDAGKSADEITRQALLIGAPADAVAQLVNGGFAMEVGDAVQAAPTVSATTDDQVANFRMAKAFMNETIVDTLGLFSFAFTLRLERCANRDDLVALLPSYTESLVKKRNRDAARALVERTRELLAA